MQKQQAIPPIPSSLCCLRPSLLPPTSVLCENSDCLYQRPFPDTLALEFFATELHRHSLPKCKIPSAPPPPHLRQPLAQALCFLSQPSCGFPEGKGRAKASSEVPAGLCPLPFSMLSLVPLRAPLKNFALQSSRQNLLLAVIPAERMAVVTGKCNYQ